MLWVYYSRFTGDDKLVTQKKGEGIKLLHADTEDPGIYIDLLFFVTLVWNATLTLVIIFLQHVESLKFKIKIKLPKERTHTTSFECACQQQLGEITSSNYNSYSQKTCADVLEKQYKRNYYCNWKKAFVRFQLSSTPSVPNYKTVWLF
jgi:hypothetical protein